MKITKYKTYLFRTVKKKLNLSLSKSHATLDFNFFDNTNKIEVKGKHYDIVVFNDIRAVSM
jgi:hypothetical protein